MKTKVKDGKKYVLVWAPLNGFYGNDKDKPELGDPLDTVSWHFA